jgi:FixJ family two-component response regulator
MATYPASMKLNALVLSRSSSSVRTLVAAFAELGIEYQVLQSSSETMDTVAAGHHSALVVDFDLPHVLQVARMARMAAAGRRPVLFGMIGPGKSVKDVFQAGANFVLYKPLDLLQVLHSFRAAQGFMREDRRHSSRRKAESLAYLQISAGEATPALLHDVTEHGISVQAAERLHPMRGVVLRFLLPGTTQVVIATGDFIWTDEQGRAGLFFRDMTAACRRDLQNWLKKHGAKKSESVRALLEPQMKRGVAAAH